MKHWIGIDLGGTFIKACIFDSKCNMILCKREYMPIESEHYGWAERNLKLLEDTMIKLIATLVTESKLDPQTIQSISISGQGKGLIMLDKQGKPLGNGIISADQRTIDIVNEWQQQAIPQQLYKTTLQPLWTGHPVSMLKWIKQNKPDYYSQINSILMSHDYLRYVLTGNLSCEITNVSESNLVDGHNHTYSKEALELLDLAEVANALPPIVNSSQIIGNISKEVQLATGLTANTNVVGGLFDVTSTALCANLEDEKIINLVLGTWNIISAVTNKVDLSYTNQYVYGAYVEPGKYLVHEDSPTSSGNLEWVKDILNLESYNEINDLVASLDKATSDVYYLPFLYGTNAALGMQACFYGLQLSHGKAELVQAVFEGVLFAAMDHLEKMIVRFPQVKTIRVTGGPTKSAVWMQMLADLTGLQIEIPTIEETGCLGAVMMSMLGNKEYNSLAEIQSMINQDMNIVTPDKSAYDKYQRKYHNYKLLVKNLEEFNRTKL